MALFQAKCLVDWSASVDNWPLGNQTKTETSVWIVEGFCVVCDCLDGDDKLKKG